MADIRIKDLATTATTTASDDFMAVDGATNGTRKLNAAAPAFLTSVTTPSLTAPASTNLTLTSGLVGTNKVNFPDTLTASSSTAGAVTIGNGSAATNVAIGGGKINAGDTTASTGVGTGALQVAGGIYAGAASVFAGAVTAASLFMSTDAQGSILSSSGNTLFIDAAAGGVTVRPKGGSVFHVSNSVPVRFSAYGAGTATFDSSGNITSVSDSRLKNITGTFTKGLAEIVKLTPKLYTWTPETGLVTDDVNATLIAQDLIAAGLSEAVATYRTVAVMEDDVQSVEDIAAGKPVTQHAKLDANGKAVTQRVDANYSVSDRTVIAALVNAVKELKAEIDALKAK